MIPWFVACVAVYFAGYWSGRAKEQRQWVENLGGEEDAAQALLFAEKLRAL